MKISFRHTVPVSMNKVASLLTCLTLLLYIMSIELKHLLVFSMPILYIDLNV